MTKTWLLFSFLFLFGRLSGAAFAAECGGGVFGNINCELEKQLKAIQEQATQDIGRAIEKATHDVGLAIQKALTPVREYLRAQDIPPPGVAAYGIVVFQSRPTPANQKKLKMVCTSFIAAFPKNETAIVPISDRMMTIWPIDDPNSEKAKADDCDFVLQHYDLNASEAAINDARKQNASFNGEGPYLVGWSPSNARGLPDKLVLVVDVSADNTQESIDHKFQFWKNKIIENPDAWRGGWNVEAVREYIKQFADQYGKDMLDAIKLVKKP